MKNTFADTLDEVLQKAHHVEDLNPKGLKLLKKTSHHPNQYTHSKVKQIELPYLDFSVNVWLYQTTDYSLLIDAGGAGSDLKKHLPEQASPLSYLVTHCHPDHIGGLDELRTAYPNLKPFTEEGFVSLSTPGHCKEHVSYYNASQGVCFCGDALFATSMGKANFSYSKSLSSLHLLLNLPEETILFPGHGPATTVKWEKEFNCFYMV